MSVNGILAAVPTPFTADGDINIDGLEQNLHGLIEHGIHGIVALATAGEAPSMTLDERLQVMDAAAAAVANQVPLIVGVGGPNERETNTMIRAAERANVSGLMLITPYFYNFSKPELMAYFRRVARSTDLPVSIYNSTYAGVPLGPDDIADLAAIDNIVGLKEGGQAQASEVIRRVDGQLSVYCARDSYLYEVLACGGAGAISFSANVVPDLVIGIYDAAVKGDWDTALRLQRRLNPLVGQLVRRSYPAPTKAAMNLSGWVGGHVRAPLTDFDEGERADLRAVLAGIDAV